MIVTNNIGGAARRAGAAGGAAGGEGGAAGGEGGDDLYFFVKSCLLVEL